MAISFIDGRTPVMIKYHKNDYLVAYTAWYRYSASFLKMKRNQITNIHHFDNNNYSIGECVISFFFK